MSFSLQQISTHLRSLALRGRMVALEPTPFGIGLHGHEVSRGESAPPYVANDPSSARGTIRLQLTAPLVLFRLPTSYLCARKSCKLRQWFSGSWTKIRQPEIARRRSSLPCAPTILSLTNDSAITPHRSIALEALCISDHVSVVESMGWG